MTIRKQTLDRAVAELAALEGAQIQRIAQSSPRELYWQLRQPGETLYLLFSIEPAQEYLCLSPQRPPALPEPPSFCMALRKHLLHARLQSVETITQDRIAAFHLRRGEQFFIFFVELIPHQGHWVLCDQDQIILQAYPPLQGTRALGVGDLYEAHPAPLPLTPADEQPEVVAATSESQTWEQRYPTHAALYQQYVVDAEAQRVQRIRQRVLKQKRTRLKKVQRLMANLERDWQRCEATLARERDAELLKPNLHQIQRGATEVVVTDYYEEGMPERTISLDPALSPQANLEKLFHRIKRARRGIETITQRMEQVEAELTQLQDAIQQIQQLHSLEELVPLLQLPREQAKSSARTTGRRRCYREYTSKDGKPIWVGRTSRDNDELTLRVAKGNDLWFHVRGWAGSHVVVPQQKNESPSTDLVIDAATLAAHFSQARNQTHIDVMMTHIKYVRKPKGAPPGQVTVIQDRNIALRMEPERLQRLLATGSETSTT